MADRFLHVDGDSFFAMCELARFPQLKHQPVVVGQDRGIACAMNYEAKKLGINRAMPIFKIKKQFPEVIILTSHFELYEMYSQRLYNILKKYSHTVERYSIDECFSLLTEEDMKQYGSWEALVCTIKREVQTSLGITFSFGLGTTKALAKTASKMNKPDGLTIITDENCRDLICNIPIQSVWGIGRRLSKEMYRKGIHTIGDFLEMPFAIITRWFSKPVQELWFELHGIPHYKIGEENTVPKSLQATRSFKRTDNRVFVLSELARNIEIIASRLRTYKLATSSVHFFIKRGIHDYITSQVNLTHASNNPGDILREVEPVFMKLYKPHTSYRATGVTAYHVIHESSVPRDLFGAQDEITSQKVLLKTVDSIRMKYGHSSISLGTSLTAVAFREKEESILNANDPYIWGLPLPFLGETV